MSIINQTPSPFHPGEPAATPADRHAYEWGLASVLLGGLLAGTAPVTLIFNLLLWQAGSGVISRSEMRLAHMGGILSILVIGLLCVTSLCFGILGVRWSVATRRPVALPLTGILVSSLALMLWIGVGGDLIAILTSFAHW
jgi:hypothetical protein